MANADDERWMQRALALAERGRGAVEPNPLVGSVIVRDNEIVGEGWHARFGGPHAEVVALAAAGERARGATLFATLEPCCHLGKTPPCTDSIRSYGISRVVAAMLDPFPEVAGKGVSTLHVSGVAVDVGVLSADARELNAPYLTLIERSRPYVHAKWAMTLDGRTATRTGDSKWISGEASRARVHELRGRMDAIIVGAGTVRADDPLLTARPPGPRRAARIVLSASGRLPPDCQLLRTIDAAPVIVATLASRGSEARLAGCDVIECEAMNGRPSVESLLAELGRRRMTNVLVEGGAEVLGSFVDARLIDEIHQFIAPKLLGGLEAKPVVAGLGPAKIGNAWPLMNWTHELVGDDLYVRGRLPHSHPLEPSD